jgi:hypothetical protein
MMQATKFKTSLFLSLSFRAHKFVVVSMSLKSAVTIGYLILPLRKMNIFNSPDPMFGRNVHLMIL